MLMKQHSNATNYIPLFEFPNGFPSGHECFVYKNSRLARQQLTLGRERDSAIFMKRRVQHTYNSFADILQYVCVK